MASKLKTAILGATGYSGFELARILLRHPGVETPVMLQRSGEAAADANLADMYPAISGNGGYPLQPWSWTELKRREIELLFLATPHEVSRALVPEASPTVCAWLTSAAHGDCGRRKTAPSMAFTTLMRSPQPISWRKRCTAFPN